MRRKLFWLFFGLTMLIFAGLSRPLVFGQAQDQPSEWAREAWGWAKAQGLTDGTNPRGACTREMVMTWVYRLEQKTTKGIEGLQGAPPTPVAATAPTRTWQRIAAFQGSGAKRTSKFTVAQEWKIKWETTPSAFGNMNFQIFVYEAAGNLARVVANVIGADVDESYEHQAGTYYLEINTAQPYTIEIWEKS